MPIIKKNDKNQIFCKCNHCGNIGYLDIRGFFKEEYYEEVDGQKAPLDVMSYYLLECPVCLKPVLVSGWYLFYSNTDEELSLDYPVEGFIMRHTPDTIKEQYLNSRECYKRNDYGLCLASLRILLEKIANNNHARGKTLERKIEDLARTNVIPLTIKNASTIVRKLGNMGAHGNGDEIMRSDIDMLFEFVEIIISYIYELPQSVSSLASRYR
jgi:hypothetical protein